MESQQSFYQSNSKLAEINLLFKNYYTWLAKLEPAELNIIQFGVTNGGKTSLLYYLSGLELEREFSQDKHIYFMKSTKVYESAIINDTTSTTVLPNVFHSKHSENEDWKNNKNFSIYDMPGLNDDRNMNKIYNAIIFKDLMFKGDVLNKIHLCIVIPQEQFDAERMLAILRQLSRLVNPQILNNFKQKLPFLSIFVTKTSEDIDIVKQQFNQFLVEIKQQIQQSEENLNKIIQLLSNQEIILTFSNQQPSLQAGTQITNKMIDQFAFIDNKEKNSALFTQQADRILLEIDYNMEFQKSLILHLKQIEMFEKDMVFLATEMAKLLILKPNQHSEFSIDGGKILQFLESLTKSNFIEDTLISSEVFQKFTMKLNQIKQSSENKQFFSKIISKFAKFAIKIQSKLQILAEQNIDIDFLTIIIQGFEFLTNLIQIFSEQAFKEDPDNQNVLKNLKQLFAQFNKLCRNCQLILNLTSRLNNNHQSLTPQLAQIKQNLFQYKIENQKSFKQTQLYKELKNLKLEQSENQSDQESDVSEYIQDSKSSLEEMKKLLTYNEINLKDAKVELKLKQFSTWEQILSQASTLSDLIKSYLKQSAEPKPRKQIYEFMNKNFVNGNSIPIVIFCLSNIDICFQLINKYAKKNQWYVYKKLIKNIAWVLQRFSLYESQITFLMSIGQNQVIESVLSQSAFITHFISRQFIDSLIAYSKEISSQNMLSLCYSELITEFSQNRKQQLQFMKRFKQDQTLLQKKEKQQTQVQDSQPVDFTRLYSICIDQILLKIQLLYKRNCQSNVFYQYLAAHQGKMEKNKDQK